MWHLTLGFGLKPLVILLLLHSHTNTVFNIIPVFVSFRKNIKDKSQGIFVNMQLTKFLICTYKSSKASKLQYKAKHKPSHLRTNP